MKDFGKHTSAVHEVLDFALNAPLLAGPGGIVASGPIISDYREAKRLAFEDTVEQIWRDVKGYEIRPVYAANFPGRDKLWKEYDQPIWHAVKKHLPVRFQDDLLETIVGDLMDCCHMRILKGIRNAFYERVFAVYKSGCWPCGWSGKYPKGEIIAFCPSTEIEENGKGEPAGGPAQESVFDRLDRFLRKVCGDLGLKHVSTNAIDAGRYRGESCTRVTWQSNKGVLELRLTDKEAVICTPTGHPFIEPDVGEIIRIYEGVTHFDLLPH